jgi:hypothetical protein
METENNSTVTVPRGPFVKNDPRINRDGRPVESEEKKLLRKTAKQIIAEYKEALAEALPMIQPILVAKAMEGDMTAIKEVHDRVMDKAKQSTEISGEIDVKKTLILIKNGNSDKSTS